MMGRRIGMRQGGLAAGAGAAIGALGGLIGLGGAEFRLPVLLGPFSLPARLAVPVNLVISLVTLVFSLAGRAGAGATFRPSPDLIGVIAALALGGVVAGWLGAGWVRRLSNLHLERLIGVLLLFVGALLVVEAVLPGGLSLALPPDRAIRIAAGLAFGVVIGLFSSLLGVAGGELIIPTLVFAFGADIVTAGTASLAISLPMVAAGVVRHRWQGGLDDAPFRAVIAPMAAGSVIGALIGAALVGLVPDSALKAALGAILGVSAVKILRKG